MVIRHDLPYLSILAILWLTILCYYIWRFSTHLLQISQFNDFAEDTLHHSWQFSFWLYLVFNKNASRITSLWLVFTKVDYYLARKTPTTRCLTARFVNVCLVPRISHLDYSLDLPQLLSQAQAISSRHTGCGRGTSHLLKNLLLLLSTPMANGSLVNA